MLIKILSRMYTESVTDGWWAREWLRAVGAPALTRTLPTGLPGPADWQAAAAAFLHSAPSPLPAQAGPGQRRAPARSGLALRDRPGHRFGFGFAGFGSCRLAAGGGVEGGDRHLRLAPGRRAALRGVGDDPVRVVGVRVGLLAGVVPRRRAAGRDGEGRAGGGWAGRRRAGRGRGTRRRSGGRERARHRRLGIRLGLKYGRAGSRHGLPCAHRMSSR